MGDDGGITVSGKEIVLNTPISEETIRSLKLDDVVLVTCTMHTGRDAIHSHLIGHDSPFDLKGQILYNCGPVALKENNKWKITEQVPPQAAARNRIKQTLSRNSAYVR